MTNILGETNRLAFVTGSERKAQYFSRISGISALPVAIDLDEIQSLNLSRVVSNKARRAFDFLGMPVIVEDVSLEIDALNGLPGTFIKWFVGKLPLQAICDMVPNSNRKAMARCVAAFCDGSGESLFEGRLGGSIATQPRGTGGFGWDPIFVPDGFNQTRAELSAVDDETTYLQLKPFRELGVFIRSRA